MTASTHIKNPVLPPNWAAMVEQTCHRIAPVWPLDSFVAVNPYLGLIDQPFSAVGKFLAQTTGERLFMDRHWFAEKLAKGEITNDDLAAAADELGSDVTIEAVRSALRTARQPSTPLPLLARQMDRRDAPPVSEFIVEQISGFLAAYYDRGQALWTLPETHQAGLYTAWRQYSLIDRSARAVSLKQVRAHLLTAPANASEALPWALAQLQVPAELMADYLYATLKTIGGWASWCRYLRWQAELQGKEHQDLRDLLTIRLVWDALVLHEMPPATHKEWQRQLSQWSRQHALHATTPEAIDEILLTAAEIAFRRPVLSGLKRNAEAENAAPSEETRPAVQAAFCIDVRSEVFRRHLESSLPNVQTIGFAGFFGVPLDFCRLGEAKARTHTPVLLNPGCRVQETGDETLAAKRQARLGRSASWKQFKLSAASCFTFVESAGLSYVPRLIADTLGWHRSSLPPDEAGLTQQERAQLHPALTGPNGTLDDAAKISIAEGILRGLGLAGGPLAPIVLLAGHGSSTTNNPHRAGLDCGACAGQTGEVSARVAASLLNEPSVRLGLAERGIAIPRDTRFLAAMHDTTTDQVLLLDRPAKDTPSAAELATLANALQRAGELTRLERLVSLDATVTQAGAEQHVVQRGRDWSQVRPEWGLAGNAAFIAAPRRRTRGLNLGGRAFLHDYDWRNDADFGILSLIMTAPLVVANWINLQYYGSTVDNLRQGSGNKVLHNVVGGLVGVLEGNGGDLRVGLSLQSLHDGEQWRHEPLRLSAFIEAPTEAMDRIVAGHEMLRQLVDNRWLHLCQISDDGSVRRRMAPGDWRPA
ncbi:YbcC family protein [Halothiobacillus sp. DCM-1]|uniref:YbcC family protein n=1 Tax=Halothiobacillus sp. DCM-1 TaxID=3112558 RepID=UPI00324A3537